MSGSLIIIVLTKPPKGYEYPEKTDQFWLTSPAKWSRTVLECSKIILECSRTMF